VQRSIIDDTVIAEFKEVITEMENLWVTEIVNRLNSMGEQVRKESDARLEWLRENIELLNEDYS
jgi:hypothetical protein